MTSVIAIHPKDPSAVEPFEVDWTAWLDGEAVASHSVTVDGQSGVEVVGTTEASGVVTAWLSGGTHGKNARITFRITTDTRTDDYTILLRIRER